MKNNDLFKRLCVHLQSLYPAENSTLLADRCLKAMRLKGTEAPDTPSKYLGEKMRC